MRLSGRAKKVMTTEERLNRHRISKRGQRHDRTYPASTPILCHVSMIESLANFEDRHDLTALAKEEVIPVQRDS